MNLKIAKLTQEAKQRMGGCADPIHDLSHVERVVSYTNEIARSYKLTPQQKDALLLAAWWHDVARTLTKNPSFIWIAFLDDILSSLMLWWATIKCRLFGGVVGLSTKVILCKSLGTGAIFTRALLGKNDRILVDILVDADKLDMLNTERTKHIHSFVDTSRMYKTTYRLGVWWWFKTGQLKLRTQAAKEVLLEMLRSFIRWIKQADIMAWHVKHYGEVWMKKFVTRLDHFYLRVSHS